jgi:hypothetical protein
MDRLLRPLGCFASTLVAILFALGVTETLKHVSPLERTMGLSAAVFAAAAVALLREKWLARSRTDGARRVAKDGKRAADAARHDVPPAEPNSDETPCPGAEAILAARRQAILFRQIVPPSHDRRHLSFFGGAPIAPRGFAWPDAHFGEAVKPLSFLMQVDCSAIPAAGRLGLLPERGVLYVFLANAGDAFRVLHHPDTADEWVEISPPTALARNHDAPLTRAWPHSTGDSPLPWPKWPFDPVLVQGGLLPTDSEALDDRWSWPGTVDVPAAIRAIPGAVVPLIDFRGRDRTNGGKLLRPFDTFPQDWGAIRITTTLIAERTNRDAEHARRWVFKDMSDGEFAALLDATSSERRHWEERASGAGLFDAVPQDERDRFWAWVMEREWLTRHVIPDAATLSVEASLTHGRDAAARIPAEAVDRIRHRHALAVETEHGLHVNIPDRMLAAPVDVQGNIDERARDHLLFLELSSNEGLAHDFGEGVLQFWIRPDDLAACRFDRIELSTTAY